MTFSTPNFSSSEPQIFLPPFPPTSFKNLTTSLPFQTGPLQCLFLPASQPLTFAFKPPRNTANSSPKHLWKHPSSLQPCLHHPYECKGSPVFRSLNLSLSLHSSTIFHASESLSSHPSPEGLPMLPLHTCLALQAPAIRSLFLFSTSSLLGVLPEPQ